MSCNFNPRSPRGERLEMFENVAYLLAFQSTFPSRGTTLDFLRQHGVLSISIHVPLAGNDFFGHAFTSLSKISIHVPLAGNDVIRLLSEEFVDDFNPRSPRGERRWIFYGSMECYPFQSTFPSRGTTDGCGTFCIL